VSIDTESLPLDYRGTVVDERGEPVAGVSVLIVQVEQSSRQGSSIASLGRRQFTVVTDDAGRFQFAGNGRAGLCDRHLAIYAHGDCSVLADANDRVGFGTLRFGVEGGVVVAPTVSVRLKTVNAAGQPVSGVRIAQHTITVAGHSYHLNGRGPDRWRIVSDSDGEIVWTGCPTSSTILAAVDDFRFAPSLIRVVIPDTQSTEPHVVSIGVGSTVSGSVVIIDEPGTPQRLGAFLTLAFATGGRVPLEATTDAQGRFSLERVPAEEYRLSYVRDPDPSRRWMADSRVGFVATDAATVAVPEIRLLQVPDIVGSVVDADTDALVAGVTVKLRSRPDAIVHQHTECVTGADGTFQLPVYLGGTPAERAVDLTVQDESRIGYLMNVRAGDSPHIIRLQTLPPVPPGSIAGSVTNRNGLPIAGARADLIAWGSDDGVVATTTTGIDGRFQFDEAAVHRYLIQIDSSGYAPYMTPRFVIVLPDETVQVKARLKPFDRPVSGRVVDIEGNPVAGATVHISGR
jgi:hypothetical protein